MIAAIEFSEIERENIDHIAGSQERIVRCLGTNQNMRPAVRREILHRIEDAVRAAEKDLEEDTAD